MAKYGKRRTRTEMKHLVESVASRNRSATTYDEYFWRTKEGIIEFLEENGFERIPEEDYYGIITSARARHLSRVYSTGRYTSDPVTHWIKFYDVDYPDHVFFCRELDIISKIETRTTSILAVLIRNGWHDFKSFKEFREEVRTCLGI